ncbi:MAG: hypothetical protein GY820_24020 [Gammaproteobacteria bacterium]|nr:hypothetical protein [Gammaproteobacteria bacterium]
MAVPVYAVSVEAVLGSVVLVVLGFGGPHPRTSPQAIYSELRSPDLAEARETLDECLAVVE